MSDIREQATREHVARWLHTTYGEWRRTWDELSERGRELLFKRADELGGMFAAASTAPEASDPAAGGASNVAAELRRLRQDISAMCDPYGGTSGELIHEWLSNRADELDGGAR